MVFTPRFLPLATFWSGRRRFLVALATVFAAVLGSLCGRAFAGAVFAGSFRRRGLAGGFFAALFDPGFEVAQPAIRRTSPQASRTKSGFLMVLPSWLNYITKSWPHRPRSQQISCFCHRIDSSHSLKEKFFLRQ
jgi:hypothetical protein